jgi:hypothetical protein
MTDKKDGSFLGGKPAGAPATPPDTNRTARMLKIVEEKLSNLDRKTEVIENNLLSTGKRQGADIKTAQSKMLELEKDIALIKRKIMEIASELKNFARTEEVETLRKYLDIWNPINFVTKEELDDILREKIERFK